MSNRFLPKSLPIDWSSPPGVPREAELHIWWWNIAANEMDDSRAAWLDEDERQRYGRFATPELRQSFLAAHTGLRKILGSYLACHPREIRFATTAAGKPRLTDHDLRFNLSHSGEYAVAAFGRYEIGIDIERFRAVSSFESLARQHLTERERTALMPFGQGDSIATFFQLWTRKEAIAKLAGLGLQANLSDLEALPTSDTSLSVGLPAQWSTPFRTCWLSTLQAPERYAAAVATAQRPSSIRSFCASAL